MEYTTPSQFNAYGMNIASPIVTGGVGISPTPPTFRYNGNSTGYYTNMGYQAQNQMNNIFGAPQQQQPYTYNPYNPNVPNPYTFNPYGYQTQYQYMDYEQAKVDTFTEAYNNGSIPLSQYICYANGGFNHTIRQPQVTDDWYANAMNYSRKQREEQERIQKENDIQRRNWEMAFRIHYRNQGIPIVDETGRSVFEQKVLFDQAMQAYQYQVQQDQQQMNYLNYKMSTIARSDQKGYVTPRKAKLIEVWNKYYEHRNGKYPKEYGCNEFFNMGIMTNQLIDNMVDDAKLREYATYFQYSKQDFRQSMHLMHPHYDPLTGTNRLTIDDMDVSLPRQISESDYFKRKQQFLDSIFKNNKLNL